MDPASLEALIRVIQMLQANEIPYMLVGAFSSNAYGYPRSTNDADVVIEFHAGILKTIQNSLGKEFRLNP
ncbi:MAG: hypothetical protein ACK5TO_08720, partial [Planctomycetaceae bacterium]